MEVRSHISNNALPGLSLHVRDTLEGKLGTNQLRVAFEAGDYDLFKSLCAPDELPSLIWAEAENIVRNVGSYTEQKYPAYKESNNVNTGAIFEYHQRWGDTYTPNELRFSHDLPLHGEPYTNCLHRYDKEGRACLAVGKHILHGKDGINVMRVNATCDRLPCPKCGKKAMLKRAGSIMNRFMRMPQHSSNIEYISNPKKLDLSQVQKNRIKTPESQSVFGLPLHIVISMPQSDDHLLPNNDGLKKLGKKAVKVATNVGVLGGVVVYHHFRQKKELQDLPTVAPDENGYVNVDSVTQYMDAMNKGGSWVVSPHWHAIGYAHDGEQYGRLNGDLVARNYEETKWVVKVVHPNEKMESVFSTTFYQITHCGIRPGEHSIKWFGVMSNGKGWFSKNSFDALPPQKPKCKICTSDMKNYVFVGNYDPFDLPDENQTLIPAVDLDKYVEVVQLLADTVIGEDTDVERIQQVGYEYVM